MLKSLSKALIDADTGEVKSGEHFALASRIFGARAVSTALALMGQLRSGYDDLSETVRESGGEMRRTAALQLEGLEPFYRLQAAIELAKISISESGVLDVFSNLSGKVADLFNKLSAASGETRRLVFGILSLATVGGPAIFIFGLLLSMLGRIGQGLLFLGSVVSFILTAGGAAHGRVALRRGRCRLHGTQGHGGDQVVRRLGPPR